MTRRSRWLDWQPKSERVASETRNRADKTDKTSSTDSFVSSVSSFSDVRPLISAAVRRVRQAGGSVTARGGMLSVTRSIDRVAHEDDIELLQRHEADAVALLEALDLVNTAGVRLVDAQDGSRTAVIPRRSDSLEVREALSTLGYSLPVATGC